MKEHNVTVQWGAHTLTAMDPGSTPPAPDTCELREVTLPKQLEAVTKAKDFPPERHRWNTNEEVAAILIAFEHHKEWQSREVKQRPASGSMLLYNRKKARYRKDGYCWKKRKDGKTTREDHMKLKVQGVECIYGCYVHSAILPTFHRRCYWLLQNPDLVLVHYLNVPLPDDNKLSLPTLQHVIESKDWSKDELISQLRPMFASVGSCEDKRPYSSQVEEMVQSMVAQLLESQQRVPVTECTCTSFNTVCDRSGCKNKCRIISPKTETTTVAAATATVTTSSLMQNRLVSLVQNNKPGSPVTTVTTPAQQRPVMTPGGTGVIINSAGQRHLVHNTPLILNLSQLQGSNGLIILSSQSPTPISIINSGVLGNSAMGNGASITTTTSASPHSSNLTPMDSIPLTSNDQTTLMQGQGQIQPTEGQIQVHGHAQLHHIQSQGQILHGQVQGHIIQAPSQGQGQLQGEQAAEVTVSNDQSTQPGLDTTNETLKEECAEEDKTSVCMEDCPSTAQGSLPQEIESVSIQNSVRDLTHDLENSMDMGQSGSYPQCMSGSGRTAAMDDYVNNVKNEMHNFGYNTLSLTQDEIQKALCANLPATSGRLSGQPDLANQSTSSLDSIEAMRTSMVSPHSTDLNFDAFDILDVLPDFDTSETIEADLTSTPQTRAVTSAAVVTTTSSSTGCAGCLGNRQTVDVKTENRAGIANITDFSPEWSYTEGGVKVLVTGPWYSTTSPYSVLFDNVSVPATLVQSGVLRCFCPAHVPGLVTLQVACEGYVISNSCVFEYKSQQVTVKAEQQQEWFGLQEDHLKMALLSKLEEIEKRLTSGVSQGNHGNRTEGKMRSHDAFEGRLLEYVDQLSQRLWKITEDGLLKAAPMHLSLLHLVAGLGYARLALALIRWRSDNPCPVLDYEVDALSLDEKSCTPLMWACARGRLETAIVLYHWNSAALGLCNKDLLTPLAVARSHGNPHIAEHIERLELARLPTPAPQGSTPRSRQSARASGEQHGVSMSHPRHHKRGSTGSDRNSSDVVLLNSPQEQTLGGLCKEESQPVFHARSEQREGVFAASPVPVTPLQPMGGVNISQNIPLHNPRGLATSQNSQPLFHIPTTNTCSEVLTLQALIAQAQAQVRNTLSAEGQGRTASVSPGLTPRIPTPSESPLSATTPSPPAAPPNWPTMQDLKIEIPPPPPLFDRSSPAHSSGHTSSQSTPSASHRRAHHGQSRHLRLLKRTSVEVLPGYLDSAAEQSKNVATKNAKTVAEQRPQVREKHTEAQRIQLHIVRSPETNITATLTPTALTADQRCQGQGHFQCQGLRSVSSDPHLVGLANQMMMCDDNPMISVNDRDLNSPVMFMQTDAQLISQSGLTLEDIHRETVAMETDSPRSQSPYIDVERISDAEADLKHTSMSFLEQLFLSVGAGSEETQNQIVTLANQIIAAMPERIKLSPSRGDEDMLVDAGMPQRERSSSHSSFSSYSSSATPPCADDSGISTPLEGLAYEEYRYPDLGTPASSLSPASSCLQSPYSFTLDSPPPTTAEFTEYFNAPTTFMEKDFSQLTLSDQEQRRLYEAAKIIQNFYRHYKDKKQQAQKQRQREIEAAILIQSYYRRYKQYAYYKKMTQAAVLIQSQFRSYYAQKRFRRSREAATVIQNQYRTYKEHERFKRSRNAAVIIQQRFRSHYQRKRSQEMGRQVQQAVKSSSHSSVPKDTDTDETARPSIDKGSEGGNLDPSTEPPETNSSEVSSTAARLSSATARRGSTKGSSTQSDTLAKKVVPASTGEASLTGVTVETDSSSAVPFSPVTDLGDLPKNSLSDHGNSGDTNFNTSSPRSHGCDD